MNENQITEVFALLGNVKNMEQSTGINDLQVVAGKAGFYPCRYGLADLELTGVYHGREVYIQLLNELGHYSFTSKGASDSKYVIDSETKATVFIVCAPSFSSCTFKEHEQMIKNIFRLEKREVAIIYLSFQQSLTEPKCYQFRREHQILSPGLACLVTPALMGAPLGASQLLLQKDKINQREVAKHMKLSEGTISRYCKGGRIETAKDLLGRPMDGNSGAHSISKESLMELLQSHIVLKPENEHLYITEPEVKKILKRKSRITKLLKPIGSTIIFGSNNTRVYLRSEVEELYARMNFEERPPVS